MTVANLMTFKEQGVRGTMNCSWIHVVVFSKGSCFQSGGLCEATTDLSLGLRLLKLDHSLGCESCNGDLLKTASPPASLRHCSPKLSLLSCCF